jgi:hypothetical protein
MLVGISKMTATFVTQTILRETSSFSSSRHELGVYLDSVVEVVLTDAEELVRAAFCLSLDMAVSFPATHASTRGTPQNLL